LKFKIPNDLLVKAGQHAAERGMTLEEYIKEAIGMLTDEQIKTIAKTGVDMADKPVQD
tara:strand:- start:677 stop:850 length:174 start_codon:yes stop_codon:yes gene_type:complete